MLKDENILALKPEWVLVNDLRKVLLYRLSDDRLEYMTLDPGSSVVISLLDGKKTVKELLDNIRYLFDFPGDSSAKSFLEQLLTNVNERDEKVAILNEPVSWAVRYNPLDFLVSPEEFEKGCRLTKPLSLLIFFSGWCQTNCIYCYSDLSNMRRLEHLSLMQWMPILDQAHDLNIRMIQLSGGDPLGRPDSIKFLVSLLERKFVFMVSTKCRISLEDANMLADAGFNEPINGIRRSFQVSIDSPDPQIADYMTRSTGYLGRATESLLNLIEVGINPIVKAVLTPFNYQQAGDLIETFAELGVRSFRLANYGHSHYRHDNCLFLSDEMKAEASDQIKAIAFEHPDLIIEGDATKFEPSPQTMARRSEEKWKVRASCSAGRTNLGIAPDGKAILCEQMPFSIPYFVGDLTKQSILDVWNSTELLKFVYPPKEFFTDTPCSGCIDFQECVYDRGYCFREALFAFGRLHHPPPDCPRAPEVDYRLV